MIPFVPPNSPINPVTKYSFNTHSIATHCAGHRDHCGQASPFTGRTHSSRNQVPCGQGCEDDRRDGLGEAVGTGGSGKPSPSRWDLNWDLGPENKSDSSFSYIYFFASSRLSFLIKQIKIFNIPH